MLVVEMKKFCWRIHQMVLTIANRYALEAVNMCRMQPKVPYEVVAGVLQLATMGEVVVHLSGLLTRKKEVN